MSCLFVEHLTVIDCAFLDAQRGLVGESWIVDVELEGALDAQSMVLDFGEVKRRLKRAIDGSVDHSLLVPLRSPGLRSADESGTAIEFESVRGRISHRSPPQAVSRVDAERIDIASVTAHLLPILQAVVPASVRRIGLQLRQEAVEGAFHHYVHGLKKHGGHCQRIAHGHRSRIDIRVDGTRDAALEDALALRWRDIYLASREDLRDEDGERLHFAYTSAEGDYALALPRSHCDLLDGDTTIECIAAHLAAECGALRPGQRVEVRAYEGVMKGARALTPGAGSAPIQSAASASDA